MEIKAYAKINLALDVVSKMPNGYHEIKTVFYETSLHDVLSFKRSDTPGIRVDYSDKTMPTGERSLVFKAANLLFYKYRLCGGVDIHIENNIPSRAGFGGGSADAAATLRAINRLFDLNISKKKLELYAVSLGADVPFMISGGTAYAEGVGDKLVRFENIKKFFVVLAKPECGVSTVEAYNALDKEDVIFHPNVEKLIEAMQCFDFKGIGKYVGNSFEAPICKIYPEIKSLKNAFLKEGAFASALTGSGSGVFALFNDKKAAFIAAKHIQKNFKKVFIYLDNGDQSI